MSLREGKRYEVEQRLEHRNPEAVRYPCLLLGDKGHKRQLLRLPQHLNSPQLRLFYQ